MNNLMEIVVIVIVCIGLIAVIEATRKRGEMVKVKYEKQDLVEATEDVTKTLNHLLVVARHLRSEDSEKLRDIWEELFDVALSTRLLADDMLERIREEVKNDKSGM